VITYKMRSGFRHLTFLIAEKTQPAQQAKITEADCTPLPTEIQLLFQFQLKHVSRPPSISTYSKSSYLAPLNTVRHQQVAADVRRNGRGAAQSAVHLEECARSVCSWKGAGERDEDTSESECGAQKRRHGGYRRRVCAWSGVVGCFCGVDELLTLLQLGCELDSYSGGDDPQLWDVCQEGPEISREWQKRAGWKNCSAWEIMGRQLKQARIYIRLPFKIVWARRPGPCASNGAAFGSTCAHYS
jgi:hypothetical protein